MTQRIGPLLCCFLASLLTVAFSQAASAKVFKIASVSPDGSTWMKTMRKAANTIEEETEGRVKIKFYPGGVMGNDQAVLRKMRIKQLQGAALTGGSLRKLYKDVEGYSLPLLFRSFEEVDYVRQRMDQRILDGIEAKGMVSFGLAEGGLAYAMSDTPVSRAEDLRSKKVWVPANDQAALAAMQAFDISPFPLDLSNVLVSLQTGMINSVATSPIAAIALQWHTQVKYISDLPLMYFFATMVIDKKAFSSISESDQALVRKHFTASFVEIDRVNRQDNENAFQALQQQGLKLVEISAEDQKEWRQRAANATNKIVEDGIISKDFYQQLSGYLEEFRASEAQ